MEKVLLRSSSSPSSGKVLPPEFYESVYPKLDDKKEGDNENDNGDVAGSDIRSSITPWDIGGPQPCVVRAYEDGDIRGRILDCGCGAGENAIFLASKRVRIDSVVGFDLSKDAIAIAIDKSEKSDNLFTCPRFCVASCTDIAHFDGPVIRAASAILSSDGSHDENKRHENDSAAATDNKNEKKHYFDVALDSALLHCLSDEDAELYVSQLSELIRPGGKALVGCFSTENPDPWENPRRISEDQLRQLFCESRGWNVVSIRSTWWSRPPQRGSKQGSFCRALWMEATKI